MKSKKNVKILVIGKASVGKTAIIKELMAQPEANVGDQRKFDMNLKVNDIDLVLTINEDSFDNIENVNINDFDGFVLVYGADDVDSFSEVKKNHQLIVKKRGTKKFSLVIVGNKCELVDDKKVQKEEGERYCSESNVDFYEMSALEKTNVKECFLSLAQNVLKFKYPEFFQDENATKKKRCFCF